MACCCEHGNEPYGFIKFWEFFVLAEKPLASPERLLLHRVGLVLSKERMR